MKEFKGIQGHIILLCKGWYQVEDVDYLTSLKRLWAVRCGIDKEYINSSAYGSIADELYKILIESSPTEALYLQERMHNYLQSNYRFSIEKFSTMEKIIYFYISRIHSITCREDKKQIVKLPKPKKQILKRIIRGNGRYTDYELLTN